MANKPPNPQTSQSGKEVEKMPDTSTKEPSALALPLFLVVLASSAGFTMYTKRAGSMLQGMERINQNVLRNHPPKHGPPTKAQYEKLRPRIDKDEFF